MVVAHPDAGFSVGSVHFTPGAQTAWHSHAAGQMLHCAEGVGLVVSETAVIVLRPGETVWTPPGVRHWHGAAPDHFMTHLAMSGVVTLPEGTEAVTWQEQVDESTYLCRGRASGAGVGAQSGSGVRLSARRGTGGRGRDTATVPRPSRRGHRRCGVHSRFGRAGQGRGPNHRL